MIVRAGDLLPEGLQVDQRLELGQLSYEAGLEIAVVAPGLRLRVLPWRAGLKCSGRLETTAMVPCSRCLEPYALPIVRDFDVAYLPAPRQRDEDGMDVQITKDDLDVAYLNEEGELDLNGLAAEQIYLALPMKPLCADGCRGLCARCGSNLNSEPCHCAATA